MSEEDLLDMDYFLNDDDLDEEFSEEGFIFLIPRSSICVARLPAGILIQKSAGGGLSYKVKIHRTNIVQWIKKITINQRLGVGIQHG